MEEKCVSRGRAILTLGLGLIFYLIAYFAPVPTLRYLPELGDWSWSPVDAISMRYYGLLIWGALGASIGWLLGGLEPASNWAQKAVVKGLLVGTLSLGYLTVAIREIVHRLP